MAFEEGVEDAFDFPGFVPAYIRPLFCRGVGPFRWAALSGDPEDIYRTDAKVKELIPGDAHLHKWLDMARARIKFQGSAGAHLLGGPGRSSPPRPRLQRDGRKGRAEGADRHRPRPSRFGLGRLPQPRDRIDAGRLGRRLRLAHAERASELRLGRDLGLAASRRRRRHGLFPARRRRDRLRRHARGRTPDRAGAYGTTRRPASCAMRTPATRPRSSAPGRRGWTCRAPLDSPRKRSEGQGEDPDDWRL